MNTDLSEDRPYRTDEGALFLLVHVLLVVAVLLVCPSLNRYVP
jgi:hypothetical protein